MQPVTARRLVADVRRKVQDRGATAWSDTEVLEAIDAAMQSIQTEQARSGEVHELESVDIPISSFTTVEQGFIKWPLTDQVLMPRRVEGLLDGQLGAVPIFADTIDSRDRVMWNQINSSARFVLVDHKRSLGILGLCPYQTIRVWFERRWPTLHYGVAGAGGSTTTMLFDTAATLRGRLIKRADVYVGLRVEFDPAAADADKIVTVTAWDGVTATFTPAIGASSVGQAYSLIVPIAPEFGTHLAYQAAKHLAQAAANIDLMVALEQSGARAADDFEATITANQSASPRRLYSSRG